MILQKWKRRIGIYILLLGMTMEPRVELAFCVGVVMFFGKIESLFIFRRKSAYLFGSIFIYSIISIICLDYSFAKFFQQFFLLLFFVQLYIAIYDLYKNNIIYIFDCYARFCLCLAVLAIVQYLAMKYLNITLFDWISSKDRFVIDDGSIRARLWFGEPAPLAAFLLPATVYTINRFSLLSYKSLLLITAGFLAFTPVYNLLISFFIILYVSKEKNIKKVFITTLTCIMGFMLNLIGISDAKTKSDSSIKFSETVDNLFSQNIITIEQSNASTFALLSNLYVAKNAPNRILGTGLGTHEQNYNNVYHSSFYLHGLNKEDAYSIMVRAFSEFGIVGLFILVFFIIRNTKINNVINISCLSYILFNFLRGGHYTQFGLIFFVVLFCFFKTSSTPKKIDNVNI